MIQVFLFKLTGFAIGKLQFVKQIESKYVIFSHLQQIILQI